LRSCAVFAPHVQRDDLEQLTYLARHNLSFAQLGILRQNRGGKIASV
jgi:hypothetical protein